MPVAASCQLLFALFSKIVHVHTLGRCRTLAYFYQRINYEKSHWPNSQRAIKHVQAAWPDRQALRGVAPGKWQREKIEFELFSRNFLEHQHDPNRCDTGAPGVRRFLRAPGQIIVCWVHNWPECPEWIEVIELSKVVKGM